MTTTRLPHFLLLLFTCLKISVQAQKRDISNGQYATPQEKEFYRLVFNLAKDLMPRNLGKWKVIKEDEDNSRNLIKVGHPVNKGVYAVDYGIKYFDLEAAEYTKANDSIFNALKDSHLDTLNNAIQEHLARHSCSIKIYFNTTQAPLHFVKNDIEVTQANAPLTYFLKSKNAGNTPINKFALAFGIGPHKKPATFFYDPSSPNKDGYVIASSILNQNTHPFSIQTIDIIIEAPQLVAEEFMKNIDLSALNQLLGKPLVKIH